ncbi:uncharacterized protein A1O9_06189 [Exophiala aquamarina CBS 119918]|uniref:Uncharacterized protein n=1 Tax=Exophiala aquamarina CBS 119918 TaxID=1182545 RepID=A0A072PG83_9EURO|nr:uncharacterized protein A1O9_06189 [Exophiala aquamarina CBS 119918]KEF58263.1 hypothetical protein A1O9_06189 [Exophiala aquamarina CBS 119918]
MEAALRFSFNSTPYGDQRFLYVDVTGKSFKLCKVTHDSKEAIKYDTIHTCTKAPAFRAFDWHPVNEDLVVVGQAGGEATLLKIAEGQQDSLSFQVRSQRQCNSVALNSGNLLAAGLDKVRTDFCLNIWDFSQRLPAPGYAGFSKSYSEPVYKLASGEHITSLKFFHDHPQLLVAGVKGQFVRLFDLREPTVGNGLQFATRCVHNIAIDWHDENYFASCYPTSDPAICVWDRRMTSRLGHANMIFGSGAHTESRAPEVSMELRNAIQNPGVIWSLRFSKAQRGCLGVLSSTGHLKVYDIGKDSLTDEYRDNYGPDNEPAWETVPPQDLFLDRLQEVAKPYSDPAAPGDEKTRVVSFDFTTSQTKLGESRIMTLSATGSVNIMTTRASPEPSTLSSVGQLYKGENLVGEADLLNPHPGESAELVRRRAQPQNALKQAYKVSRQNKVSTETKRMSSLADQEWYSDLGFYEKNVPIQDMLTLNSIQQLRCKDGYLLDPTKNKAVVSDSRWLQALWAWVEKATKSSRRGSMVQDNFDLSYVGVYGLWMEDINSKNRSLGPSSNKLAKIIENLVRRLNIPELKGVSTEYYANRQLCLHASGLAWSYEDIEVLVKRLVAQNQHTKAAALAMFASQRKLAYKALRGKGATQSHKMLAMAIAGASRRRKVDDNATSGDDADTQDDWNETVSSLAEELTDPYARGILTYVKSGDWETVLEEESIPLKYRVCIALRHLDDSKVTHYISQVTKEAVAKGDIEGVVLTGTATQEAFDLISSYLRRFGDLQTSVLVLCPSIPRYLDDDKMVRRFNGWKDAYRNMMNSWNLKFDRVRFDIGCQNTAVDEGGRRLLPPAKQQVRLVCGFCAQGIAHSSANDRNNSPGQRSRDGQKPIMKEKAAALGTVCPKCGRHLPRCGVCDLWLGMPDGSYLPWYSSRHKSGAKESMDLSASMTGSIQTTIGPSQQQSVAPQRSRSPRLKQAQQSQPVSKESSSTSEASNRTATQSITSNTKMVSADAALVETSQEAAGGEGKDRAETEAAERWDTAMSRFTVLCVKCSHGCHAAHARMWFQKHRVCPVPECSCLCNE